jgi:hypothetical protein
MFYVLGAYDVAELKPAGAPAEVAQDGNQEEKEPPTEEEARLKREEEA